MAPLSGVIVPLEKVPDPVFAERLVGDGVSIDPVSQELLAPCDARVIQVHRAKHALTLDADGIEIVIHIGLDTVELKGDGFTAHVKTGDSVRQGDKLITFDAELVATRARSLLTQVLIANTNSVGSIRPRSGMVRAGRDVLMEVNPAPASSAEAYQRDDTAESQPIVIANDTGLHARPAALVAAAARKFTADVRLVKDGREANARSVVSIMALEVSGGDTVTVVARGENASEVVAAIEKTLRQGLGTSHPPEARSGAGQDLRGARAIETADESGRSLRGVGASPGVAIGQVFQLRHLDAVIEERGADPNHERRDLEAAIASAHLQLEALRTRMAAEADNDRAAIFGAHQELLEDPEVLDEAARHIRNGASAAFAWRQAYTSQAERLLGLRNKLLAGRAADLRDVGRRVLHLLIGDDDSSPIIPADSIVVAEDLAPSEAASLNPANVRGFCTTMGSATSHVAILARGLGIPAVAGINPRALEIPAGTRVVLDGDKGTLELEPTREEEEAIRKRQGAAAVRRSEENAASSQPATTVDGHRVEVVANIGDELEAVKVVEAGGEGVGLLRTEFLFMDRRTAPDEDEQTRVYENIACALGPDRIFVIRTLDVGGDKPLSYMPIAAEANPFLGERGIRLMYEHPEILRTQIRAILRAARSGRVAVMFPMIATLDEWRQARGMVEEERAELGSPAVQIGIMVETASAALLADRFAEEADFFSIGTNDLTQYTLAMDRTNPRLAKQLDALHPAVLQLIERTIAGADKHGKWVGLCGALAGDPEAVPVLVGLGIHELSVSVPAVASTKARVRSLSFEECRTTAQEALRAADGAEVRAIVNKRHGDKR
ncbi:MAG: phosphoenolpyruvate--protein phosphotransferase [Gemmatimonadales bacterium]